MATTHRISLLLMLIAIGVCVVWSFFYTMSWLGIENSGHQKHESKFDYFDTEPSNIPQITTLTNSTITIITSDNRNITSSNYNGLAAIINYIYAQKHGYNFIVYQWQRNHSNTKKHTNHRNSNQNKMSIMCPHSLYGKRSAPWCKLISIFHALYYTKFNTQLVFYLDSDAIFANHNISIEQYLDTADYFVYHPNSALITSSNRPWSRKSTSGSMIFKKNEISKCILHRWWNDNNIQCSRFYMQHGRRNRRTLHDQHCLQTVIADCYNKSISVLNDHTFQAWPSQFIRHVGSGEKQKRMTIFNQKLNELIIDRENVDEKINMKLERIRNDHMIHINEYDQSKVDIELQYDPDSVICHC